MNRQSPVILFTGLIILMMVLLFADLTLGSVRIPIKQFLSLFNAQDTGQVYKEIILNYRLPKALTAVIAGVSLSVAGLLMQTLFRNPLAGPDVLGINAGAGLGVALITMFSGSAGIVLTTGAWGLALAAITGAVVVLLLVMLTSVRVPDLVSLLIVGMMFGYIGGALVSVIQNVSNPDTLKVFIVWTFGSLSAVSWSMMPVLIVVTGLGLVLSLFITKDLNALLIGEPYAKGLGVSVAKVRLTIIVATALLAGGITAFAGPITFIGVTVPHIARGLFKSWDHRIILPATMLCGACLLLMCDIVTQLPLLGGNTLPVNSVTALFGAPVIIWIILRRSR